MKIRGHKIVQVVYKTKRITMVPINGNDSCLNDPNFAVICSFLQKYAHILDIMNPSFKELQDIIESTNEGELCRSHRLNKINNDINAV